MSAGVIDTIPHHISLLELAVEAAETESPLVEVSEVTVTSPVATPLVMSFMTEHNAKSGKSQTKYCRLLATNTDACRMTESLVYSTAWCRIYTFSHPNSQTQYCYLLATNTGVCRVSESRMYSTAWCRIYTFSHPNSQTQYCYLLVTNTRVCRVSEV